MNMILLKFLTVSVIALFSVSAVAQDRFDSVKSRLARAHCLKLEFTNILESDVFDTVDTTKGTALMSQDGHYRIHLGRDWYVYNGKKLYSYSHDNDQVTVEKFEAEQARVDELSFLTRLDEYYKTTILTANSRYHLTRVDGENRNIPDSLIVTLDKKRQMIRTIEYVDDSGEQNLITITKHSMNANCKPSNFTPRIPKSADIVRLD